MKLADTLSEMQAFLRQTIDESRFSLSRIPLSAQSGWTSDGGYLAHRTHGFFYVAGLRHAQTGQEQLVLYQPQSAITGLALCRARGTVYILLQARIEPGNTGIGQYGPTIQSTPANFLKLHGGKQTACLEYFYQLSPAASPLNASMQLDLGKRYFQKSKTHQFVELSELTCPDGPMIWVSLQALQESLGLSNFLNADLRSLISVFDWDQLLSGVSVCACGPAGARLQRQLAASPAVAQRWKLCPLTELADWQLTDDGVADRAGNGLSVEMYQTDCGGREVGSWAQPLMSARGVGLVLLLMRHHQGQPEFLVSVMSEFGISGLVAIGPSLLVYPGEALPELPYRENDSQIVARFVQSDEGGRFYQHESEYQVVLVDEELPVASHQYWLPAADLRFLLGSSNRVSFQLRCIASCLFDDLNPRLAAARGEELTA